MSEHGDNFNLKSFRGGKYFCILSSHPTQYLTLRHKQQNGTIEDFYTLSEPTLTKKILGIWTQIEEFGLNNAILAQQYILRLQGQASDFPPPPPTKKIKNVRYYSKPKNHRCIFYTHFKSPEV